MSKLRSVIAQIILKAEIVRDVWHHYRTEYYLISHPKCGRTWLRFMLAKAIAVRLGDPRHIVTDPMEVVLNCNRRRPIIHITHDGVDDVPAGTTQRGSEHYRKYRHKKVIFLVRDPRDVTVSYYFERTLRQNETYTLREFIRHPWWGAARTVDFMRQWYEHRHVPMDFLLIRYEDLHRDPGAELRNLMGFLGFGDSSDHAIELAVAYSRFENMRKMSLSELQDYDRLAPTDPDDEESYKVRRGKVGGYIDYLSRGDIEYIEKQMLALPREFGYRAGNGR